MKQAKLNLDNDDIYSQSMCTNAGPLMHLLLDLIPQNLPAAGVEAAPHALRLRAAALFRSYAADRPSFARSVLKIAQVIAVASARLCRGCRHAVAADAVAGAAVLRTLLWMNGLHARCRKRTIPPLPWQGFGLKAAEDVDEPYVLRYVRRLIDGRASQQNLTPAIGLIMHFQVPLVTRSTKVSLNPELNTATCCHAIQLRPCTVSSRLLWVLSVLAALCPTPLLRYSALTSNAQDMHLCQSWCLAGLLCCLDNQSEHPLGRVASQPA